jgi:hypothetical protein
LRNIHVLDGQFDVTDIPPLGTTVPPTTIRQGQNHGVTSDFPRQTYNAVGSKPLSILTLSVNPAIRLNISTPILQSIFPPVTEWSCMGGSAEMAIRLITMQPKASYQLTTSAGVIYQLVDGKVEAVPNDRTGSKSLLQGQSIGQASGRGLVLTNRSDKVAHVLQGIVSTTSLMPSSDSLSDYELKVDVEILMIANANTSLSNQDFILSLTTDTLEVEEQLSILPSKDSTLLTVAEGEVQASLKREPMEIKPSQKADPADASAGDSITIGVGGQAFAQPGSSFSLQSSKEAAKLVRLNITPKAAMSTTPVTIPFTGDVPIAISPMATPLTLTDLDTLLATPALGMEFRLNRSLRDAPAASQIQERLLRVSQCSRITLTAFQPGNIRSCTPISAIRRCMRTNPFET